MNTPHTFYHSFSALLFAGCLASSSLPSAGAPLETAAATVSPNKQGLNVHWDSTLLDQAQLWISNDPESFQFLRDEVGAHGTTTAVVPFSDFGNSPKGFVQVRTNPGPGSIKSHPCLYFQYLNWNYAEDGIGVVDGKVWFPSDTCDSDDGPPLGCPIVVFMHGNGMDFETHDYLLRHLTLNGFVTCSIENSGDNETRARDAISYLNSMFAYWEHKNTLSGEVIFAGHGRGGEAAITAARLLHGNPGLAHTPYTVKSVVSIAPTDGGGSQYNDPKENISGAITPSFLAIYGSRDGDVLGNDLGIPGPEETPFAIYDRAGSENSLEGILLSNSLLAKSMVYCHQANNSGFRGDLILGNRPWQQAITKAYLNAFLRWQVFGEGEHRKYFDGTALPDHGERPIFTQFSDGSRRVLDNFEQGGWATNTQGGGVTKGADVAAIAEHELHVLDSSAPHDSQGMRIKWNGNDSWVRWDLPANLIPIVGQAQNVTNYDVLSFRVAQNHLDAWNTPGADVDFYVGVTWNGGFFPSLVQVSDFGRIPSPDPFIVPFNNTLIDGNLVSAGDYTKSGLNTIRIPLDAFQGADLTQVNGVFLLFTVDGQESGSIIVDSLEFTN